MGVHTGDSITVAPAQTLTDKEYQRLRDQARIGDACGGRGDWRQQRAVWRRPAKRARGGDRDEPACLALQLRWPPKQPAFPIAKLAAKVAVGYTLDELKNDITQQTVAAFEPSIDYVVVKIPRWAFEKFPGVDRVFGPQMKSVGEVMAIGRTFKEALQKGIRSLEIGA